MVDLTIFLGLLIIFVASIVQGITGFGFALTALPFLAILISLHTVVPIMVVFCLLSNILMLVSLWSHVKLKKIWILIVSSVIAAPLGTYLLLIIEQNTLKIIIGFIIVVFAFALWKGFSVKIKNEKLALIPIGFSSGLLNGSLSLSGPPVVLFLTNQDEDKETFRANITVCSLILNTFTIFSFFIGGLIDKEVMKYIYWFSPVFILGILIGIKIGNKVEQALFKKITLILIIGSGVSAIITAF